VCEGVGLVLQEKNPKDFWRWGIGDRVFGMWWHGETRGRRWKRMGQMKVM